MKEHCFHVMFVSQEESFKHVEVCCHCGAVREAERVAEVGHGPHLPVRERKTFRYGAPSKECVERENVGFDRRRVILT